MIWLLGLVAALAAGVVLTNVLLRRDPPRRKSRPPLVWHPSRPAVSATRSGRPAAVASSPSSFATDDLYLAAGMHGWSGPEPSYSAHDPSPACDPGGDASHDSGGCDSTD